jgi:hypothetical protein
MSPYLFCFLGSVRVLAMVGSFGARLNVLSSAATRGVACGSPLAVFHFCLRFRVRVLERQPQSVWSAGGERSFISLSFLLAVATEVSSPLHCMDEFDIFMDTMYRGVRTWSSTYEVSGLTPALSTTCCKVNSHSWISLHCISIFRSRLATFSTKGFFGLDNWMLPLAYSFLL